MDGQKPLSLRKPAICNHTGVFRPVCPVSRPVASGDGYFVRTLFRETSDRYLSVQVVAEPVMTGSVRQFPQAPVRRKVSGQGTDLLRKG